jgi:hypothetical protein
VDLRDYTAKCCPTMLIQRKRHHLLTIRNQMGAEYGAHAHGITGALELDRSIDPIRVGAGERGEPPLGRRMGEYLWTRNAEAEGVVGVGVEVSKHR